MKINSGSPSIRLKITLIILASGFLLYPGLCAAQTLCDLDTDHESPAADGGPQPQPEGATVYAESLDPVAAAETAPAIRLPRPVQGGPYAEAINTGSRPRPLITDTIPLSDVATWGYHVGQQNHDEPLRRNTFNWREAVKQSFLFLTIQQTLRLAIEPETRGNLRGPFFGDYFRTLTSLRGWGDGDSFATNYVGHPMMGAVSGFIQIHNDPAGMSETLKASKAYRDSRLKALAWSAAYSLQFELGLLSEASLGNVGMTPRKTSRHPMAFVDLVVTPLVGTSWLIGEDALDRYVIDRIERRTDSRLLRNLARSFFNPTRSIANMLRFKHPWHRDTR